MLAPWKKSNDKPKQHIKKQRHYFADKDPSSQSYGFSSTHVGMWELDNRKGWAPKNWFLRTVVLEKTLESPLDCKEFKPVNPKGNQHWIFIGRADAEVEAPMLWPPAAKNWLIGKDWCWERLRAGGEAGNRNEVVGWHHQLNGHEFEQAPGVSDGQGSLVCCSPWGHKESGMTEWLNHNIKLGLGFIFVFPFSYLFDPAPFIDKVVFDKFVPMPWSATFFTNQVPVYTWICF